MSKELTFSEKIAASWKDPKVRAARLKHRSQNASWKASRHRCAVKAANALHNEHKASYLKGQEKHGVTMKAMYKDPKFRTKQATAVRKANKNPDRCKRISKSHKAGRKNGTITHKFWELANTSHGPSKKELKVLNALLKAGLNPIHQFKIPGTLFVGDICFAKEKIIVEVDGHPYHYTSKGKARRRMRDRIIRSKGFTLIHINQKALDGSIKRIVRRIKNAVTKK